MTTRVGVSIGGQALTATGKLRVAVGSPLGARGDAVLKIH